MTLTRRTVLTGLAVSGLASWASHDAHAGDRSPWHVVYLGTQTQAEAAELRDILGVHLGEGVAEALRLVKRGADWVVMYDRSDVRDPFDAATAASVASRHDTLLRRALELEGPVAEPLMEHHLAIPWDVQYGPPGSKGSLAERFDQVASILGPGVAKDLSVLPQPDGRSVLVWQRQGGGARTREIARHHSQLLSGVGVAAKAVPSPAGRPSADASTQRLTHRPLEAGEDRAPVQPLPDLPSLDDLPDTAETDTAEWDTGREETEAPPAPAERAKPSPLPPALAGPLEDTIDRFVKGWRARGHLEPIERTAWIVHDLEEDQTLADINADVPMQAASMIKPWVALAFFHRAAQGEFQYGPRSRRHLERMIQVSSNDSTNWMIRVLGGPHATQRTLRRHYPEISASLRLVEYIPADGRTYENRLSVRDHMRLLRRLWRDDLPYSQEMLRVMHLPGADRIFHRVPEIPAGTLVYDKTGTTAMCCGDMGILVARHRDDPAADLPYILIGIIERSSRSEAFTQWVRSRADLIRGVSGLTYRWLKVRRALA